MKTIIIGYTGLYTFAEGICPKENVISRLEFELANVEAAVKHVSL